MRAKLKKGSTKAVTKKSAAKPVKVVKTTPKEPKKEASTAKEAPTSSLHRMLTAEGWKRLMMNKD